MPVAEAKTNAKTCGNFRSSPTHDIAEIGLRPDELTANAQIQTNADAPPKQSKGHRIHQFARNRKDKN